MTLMTNEAPLIQVPPGLKGVAVTDTAIGDVRGREGFYHYRQYSAVDLAEHRSFEDVWYLFVEGHLPDDAERRAFAGRGGPAASRPRRGVPALAPIAGVGAQGAARRPAQRPVGAGRGPQDASRARHRRGRAPPRRPHAGRGHAHAGGRPPPAPARPRPDRAPARSGHRRQPAVDDRRHRARRRSGPGPRAVPHRHHRPRVQRLDLHRPGHRLHRGRRGRLRGGRGRRPVRARCTAAPPAGPSTCSTRSAPPTASTRWWCPSSSRGERIMGFGHAVYQGEDPRSQLLREVARRPGRPPGRAGRGRRGAG